MSGFSSESFDLLGCFSDHEQFNHRIQLHGDQLDHLLKLINKMEFYLSVDCSAYGKTVLLNMIAGLETPTKGKMLLDGEEISGRCPRTTRRSPVWSRFWPISTTTFPRS